MSARVKLAVKQHTQLQLPHGSRIYAYNNILTNQVVYSLDRSLDNDTVLQQLPFAGKKSVPKALRKDHWKPFFVIKFGLPHQGLNAFKKLREWRKLHELCWDPKDVPKLEHSYEQKQSRTKKREEREKLGGARRGGARSRLTEWKMRRKMVIMNQKANSVADLAAVLVEQEAKVAVWAPERERLFASIMEWLPNLVTDGKLRKERMAAINEEIAVLEQKVKDAKATTGKKWALPLASKITNLNRDLKLKKTEHYQIQHLPELFDISRYAQNAAWRKSLLFEALCEKEFLIRWQYTKLEAEIRQSQESNPSGREEVNELELELDELRAQLKEKADAIRELEENPPLTTSDRSAEKEHRKQVKIAVSEITNLKNSITLTKSKMFRTGHPPEWLKREMFEKRVYDSLDNLLRKKPKLSASFPLRQPEIAKAIDAALDELTEVPIVEDVPENSTKDESAEESATAQPTEEVTTESPSVAEPAEDILTEKRPLSGKEERANARQKAREVMKQIKEEEAAAARTKANDKPLQLALRLKDYGNYQFSTTWLSIFPDFLTRYMTTMTSIAPKLSNEIRLSDVSVEWSNPLDAEYGAEWPAQVQHAPMGFVRHSARSEKYEPLLQPVNDSFAYDAEGKLLSGSPDTANVFISKLQAKAHVARSKELVRSATAANQRLLWRHRRTEQAVQAERKALEKWTTRTPKGPVGEELKRQALADLELLNAREPKMFAEPKRSEEMDEAYKVVEGQRRKRAARAPKKLVRGRGRGHYGLKDLGLVKVWRPRVRKGKGAVEEVEETI
ncbi:hypothetical protein K461DRAFT_308964 [Myriangium duriaei CBS 260.36]|uniref:Large ribosomal subunit protein mL67 n=1 Tax=Myriangium duriaei CBS 260.36 TaxID=1168546 RepID=A0A9P4J7B8_9PEZI|nr:hypothetical protein K461DRAFT_308964 [Myriangium duriaei CBS 260.36]